MIRHARFHGWDCAQRLVIPTEIIVHVVFGSRERLGCFAIERESPAARTTGPSSKLRHCPSPSAFDDGGAVGGDAGVGGRAADQRDHGGQLASVVGRVVDDVLEQRAERGS